MELKEVNTLTNPEQVRTDAVKRAFFKPFVLPLLLVLCTLFYYFGELVDWAVWDSLRNEFLYGVHDIHRILFLIPICYAGYTARVRGAVIITLVSFLIFLPRAFFISPYPDPLLRMVLFVIIAGAFGCLTGMVRNETERAVKLEAVVENERDKLLKILDGMADGIMITGPDYRIRFMNAKMLGVFGDGTGLPCYQHLGNLDAQCQQDCRILDIINNEKISKWECSLPDGKTYEVVGAPHVDTDGTTCQLSIFRDVTQRKYT